MVTYYQIQAQRHQLTMMSGHQRGNARRGYATAKKVRLCWLRLPVERTTHRPAICGKKPGTWSNQESKNQHASRAEIESQKGREGSSKNCTTYHHSIPAKREDVFLSFFVESRIFALLSSAAQHCIFCNTEPSTSDSSVELQCIIIETLQKGGISQ